MWLSKIEQGDYFQFDKFHCLLVITFRGPVEDSIVVTSRDFTYSSVFKTKNTIPMQVIVRMRQDHRTFEHTEDAMKRYGYP